MLASWFREIQKYDPKFGLVSWFQKEHKTPAVLLPKDLPKRPSTLKPYAKFVSIKKGMNSLYLRLVHNTSTANLLKGDGSDMDTWYTENRSNGYIVPVQGGDYSTNLGTVQFAGSHLNPTRFIWSICEKLPGNTEAWTKQIGITQFENMT